MRLEGSLAPDVASIVPEAMQACESPQEPLLCCEHVTGIQTVASWRREAGTEGMGMLSQGRGMEVAMATPTRAMGMGNIAMASQARGRRMGPTRRAALGSLDEPSMWPSIPA